MTDSPFFCLTKRKETKETPPNPLKEGIYQTSLIGKLNAGRNKPDNPRAVCL